MLLQPTSRRAKEFSNKGLQVTKHKEEYGLLQKAMQSAASDASKELQSKDKRIHQLEKKVSGHPTGVIPRFFRI